MATAVPVQNLASTKNTRSNVDHPEKVSTFNSVSQKVLKLAGIFIAATRAYGGSIAAVGGGVGIAVALHRQFVDHPSTVGNSPSSSVSAKRIKLIKNLESSSVQGTKVLVIDLPVGDPHDPSHSSEVAFVVNSHLDKSGSVTTLLYKDGVGFPGPESDPLCNLADLYASVAKLKNPPDVVASAVGKTTDSKLGSIKNEIDKFSPYYRGQPPAYPKSALKGEIVRVLKQLPTSFNQDKSLQCSNGLGVEQHMSASIQALVDAGVNVVMASHNAGALYESLKDFGIGQPENAFDAIGYGSASSNPPGLIVVGGVGPFKEGNYETDKHAGPLSTIDVAALSVNVAVNSKNKVSSGVSFAMPQVAAIATNIKSINPKLTPAQVEQIIKQSATPLPGQEARVGAGIVNPQAAYKLARQSRSIW